MIVQEFFEDGNKILTIVHEKMDEGIENRSLNDSISIDGHIISFKEYFVNKFKLDDIECDLVIQGFLKCKDEKNPYKEYSTFFKEFVNFQENAFFEDNSPIVPIKEYNKLYKFIKDYSNYNFTKYSWGNVLFFSPVKIKTNWFWSDNFPYLKISGCDVKGRAIIKFKLNHIILESVVLEDIYDGQKIFSNYDWNNYEIEIYDGMKLIFKKQQDLIRNINMHINMETENYKVNLKKSNKPISLNPQTIESYNTNERKPLDHISKYLTDEFKFYSNFINVKKDKCIFLRKNEREKALDLFNDLTRKSGEIWIFDPYFLSQKYSDLEDITDFLMILINNVHRKHIVFSKYRDGSFESFKNDLSIPQLAFFKKFGFQNVEFIESKEDFHDRFIFFVSKNKIEGYQLGTSINSLGKNYSNIVKLNAFCCHYIFKILMDDIVSENSYRICD